MSSQCASVASYVKRCSQFTVYYRPNDGNTTFLRNVSPCKSLRRNVPEDGIILLVFCISVNRFQTKNQFYKALWVANLIVKLTQSMLLDASARGLGGTLALVRFTIVLLKTDDTSK
jgi:hypothetical protein